MRKMQQLDDTSDFHHDIIQSFRASCFRLMSHRSEKQATVVWLLLDHVILTFLEPVHVVIGLRQGKTYNPIFSNRSSQDRDYLGLPTLSDEDMGDQQAHALVITDKNRNIRIVIHFTTHERNGSKIDVANKTNPSYNIVKDLLNIACTDFDLGIGLDLIRTSRPSDHQQVPSFNRNPAASDELDIDRFYCEPLRRQLGPVLDGVGSCRLTEMQNGKGLNLRIVLRIPSMARIVPPASSTTVSTAISNDKTSTAVRYNYSASIVISDRQRALLSESDESHCHAIEYPLQDGERSIADTAFGTGCIDVSLEDERKLLISRSNQVPDDHPKKESINKRAAAEEALLKLTFAAECPEREEIFYVPIHIHGQPWCAIFAYIPSFATVAERRDWCIYFYRDVVPGIGEAIARSIEGVFAEQLTGAFARHLNASGDTERLVQVIDNEWREISSAFPYGPVTLSTTRPSGTSYTFTIPGSGTQLHIGFATGAHALLPHRMLAVATVGRRIERGIRVASTIRDDGRRSLMALCVHEWVKRQSGGLYTARALRLKLRQGSRPEQDNSDDLLGYAYALVAGLEGDFGLPWITREVEFKSSNCTRYLTSAAPSAKDLQFVELLFRYQMLTILAAENELRRGQKHRGEAKVKFSFTGEENSPVKALVANGAALLEVGENYEEWLSDEGAPWPLEKKLADEILIRDGMLSVLTLAPREFLRNALTHGDSNGVIEVTVGVEESDSGAERIITTIISNSVSRDVLLESARIGLDRRCRDLNQAVPIIQCAVTALPDTHSLVVTCRIRLGGATNDHTL